MANMLQSSQTQATQAPGFYTDYLSNIASQGSKFAPGGACAPQFAGEQALQTKAFQAACQQAGAFRPMIAQGAQYIGCAAKTDITGAAQPYLQAGTTSSPLCAAKPLICQAASLDPSALASVYMSPYVKCAVSQMSDIAMRNIRQNLSPQATAAAVGSGQFGSQRGAQVLGQVQSNAMQDLNSQIANMMNTGYNTALNAALQKQNALGQLASTTASAQQAQNTANLQAAQNAINAAAQEAGALQQAGLGMGTLGTQGQNINLACINALSTLGGQQQTIAQNRQNFPITTLSNIANLLQGYSIPTTTQTTLCMSPLSGVAAIGSIGKGIACSPELSSVVGKAYTGLSGMLTGGLNNLSNIVGGNTTNNQTGGGGGGGVDLGGDLIMNPDGSTSGGTFTGGSGSTGCAVLDYQIGLTDKQPYSPCGCAEFGYIKNGGSIQAKAAGGSIGCKSTRHRGGLPG